MKIEMMMIGAVLFGLIFVLGLDVYSSGLSDYDVSVDTSTTWGKMSYNAKQIKDYDKAMRDNIRGGSVTEGDAVDDMVRGGYESVKDSPFGAIGVAANATETLMMESHMVPAEVISFLMVTLSILVTFAIIALIFRFEQR